jgi:hypothetical protein
MFTLNEATIYVRANEDPITLSLWFVQGDNYHAYPTKVTAEAAARCLYPDETVEQRYARLYWYEFEHLKPTILDPQASAIDAEDAARGGL